MCVFRDFFEIPKNDVNVRFSGFPKTQRSGGGVNVHNSGLENFEKNHIHLRF